MTKLLIESPHLLVSSVELPNAFSLFIAFFRIKLIIVGKDHIYETVKAGVHLKAAASAKNSTFLIIFLVITGILGLMLPVIPGWLLLFAGLVFTRH